MNLQFYPTPPSLVEKLLSISPAEKLAGVDPLKSAGSGEDLGDLVRGVLINRASDARYEFSQSDARIYSCGDIASARAIAEAADVVAAILDGSYAGACIAGILTRHPLVESFTLEFTTSQEYSDGSYYTAKNVNVIDLAFVEGSENGEADSGQYANVILDEIRDLGFDDDLYAGFVGPEPGEDLDAKVSRTALKHLLEMDKIDGLAVAKIVLETVSVA